VAPALILAAAIYVIVVAAASGPAYADDVIPRGTAGVVIGLALAVLGLAVAPAAVRLHGLLTRTLLQPAGQAWWHRSGIGPWLKLRTSAAWHAAGLAGLALACFGAALATAVLIVLSFGGWVTFAASITRPMVDVYRRMARQWTGEELPAPYLPYPRPPLRDEDGMYRVGRGLHRDQDIAVKAQRQGWILRDPATWRDLLWSAGAPLFAVPSLIAAALVCVGFFGLFWQAVWWAPWGVPVGLTTGTWVTPFYMWYGVRALAPGVGVIPDWASVPIGLVMALAGLLLALPVLRLRVWWDRRLLHPTTTALLAHRVEHLTETRADAVDAQAAELRRIERDLHDGAQARLVSVGLTLAAIEHLLQTDPERARAMIAQARQTSATALSELRDLVRGIHPPVLAERGLSEAIRAVALDTPVPVTVTTSLAGRTEAPIETAAYFAVCEALANAVRHARAGHIEVTIEHLGHRLTITVTDDGRGGADPGSGTGLAGIQRRLGTFDGVLRVTSPQGGPTVLVIEIPCALVTAG
jgi:signal transduction histidine kinase